jgi:hypothetical protein
MSGAVAALVLVNFGLGIWVAIYLTMAQEVSSTHVSTAIGILSGCGSLAGAMPTALGEHAVLHAHPKRWAWHPATFPSRPDKGLPPVDSEM